MGTIGFIKKINEQNIKNESIIVEDTFTHSIAFGETGCGKTTGFIYPNLKKRLELGHGILLYDYKGKEHISVKHLALKSKRLDDVIEIGKPWGKTINIIQNMGEDELDKFFDTILDHGKDSKFWHNSAKSLGQSILKILKGIEGFSKEMSLIDKNFDTLEYIEVLDFKYPKQRSLVSLVEVCKSFEYLGNFIKRLENLDLIVSQIITKSIYKADKNNADIELLKVRYEGVIKARLKLKECIKSSQKTIESFGEDSNENLTQNIMGSLIAPLISLAQNSYFNKDDFDIVNALNNGKIIVINTESLSQAVVENLNNTILYELSKRTRKTNVHPVSIFIDEVQRMLSEKTDLPIDVFREAKVDLFLATQNSALIKDKLKEEKFEALMGNLTRKFYFKNSTDEELESKHDLSSLDSFEYVSSLDSYEEIECTFPIYIKDLERIKVEYRYQKKLKVLQSYLYPQRNESLVLEYDPRLYSDGKIIVKNMLSMEDKVLDIVSRADIKQINDSMEIFFRSYDYKESEIEIDFFDAV